MSGTSTHPPFAAHPHPSAALGVAYNPFDAKFSDCPYPFYAEAQRKAPVAYSPLFDVWVVTGYAELQSVLKEPMLFSSAQNLDAQVPWPPEVNTVLERGYSRAPGLFNNDPPGHTRARALFSTAFTQGRVAQMEPVIRSLAGELVDRFVADGRADLLSQFAFPLPMMVITDLIGIPREDIPRVKGFHDDWMLLYTPGLSLERQIEAAHSIVAYQQYYAALLEDRRVNPRADLATALVQARVHGETPFTVAEMISHLVLLLSAGHETTTNLIGNMVVLLLQRPEIWRELDADPRLVGPAMEEALRLESPVKMEPRVTTAPVELGGVALPKGARLHLVFGAANRDPAVFEAPERFNLHRRNPTRHLGFGWGVHFCIGALLARLEARIALEVLRSRLPGLRLAPEFTPEYVSSFFFRGFKRIPILWDPPPTQGVARG